jgi:hypothetical protein
MEDKKLTPEDVYGEWYPEIVLKNTEGYIWADFRALKKGDIFASALRGRVAKVEMDDTFKSLILRQEPRIILRKKSGA